MVGCEDGRVMLFSFPNVRYNFHNSGFLSTVGRVLINTVTDHARYMHYTYIMII